MFDFTPAHPEAVRIDRNGLTVLEQIGCALQSEDCRHAEFSGHIGQMPGRRPLFGDQGRSPAKQSGPPGQRLFYNQDSSLREKKGLAFFPDRENRPEPGSGTSRKAPRDDEFTGRDIVTTLLPFENRIPLPQGAALENRSLPFLIY